MKTIILTGAGFVFLGLGAVGLLLPIWPTTPFVLVSAACFSYSPRLRAKIMSIGFFKEHFENYQTRQGLSRKTVWISLGYLWGMLLISMLLMSRLWSTCLLCSVGAAVTVHILLMARPKPVRPGKAANSQDKAADNPAKAANSPDKAADNPAKAANSPDKN